MTDADTNSPLYHHESAEMWHRETRYQLGMAQAFEEMMGAGLELTPAQAKWATERLQQVTERMSEADDLRQYHLAEEQRLDAEHEAAVERDLPF